MANLNITSGRWYLPDVIEQSANYSGKQPMKTVLMLLSMLAVAVPTYAEDKVASCEAVAALVGNPDALAKIADVSRVKNCTGLLMVYEAPFLYHGTLVPGHYILRGGDPSKPSPFGEKPPGCSKDCIVN